ncbi:hypothetical protein SNE40_023445 [Patella caerulea]|uniref:Uncharacterized protein n=1 Tax=Patella caerulea TaxID=87958 RepID=A0AAN8G374_PATCE
MTGRVIIVTGANVGLGFLASKILCEGGNEVILACRNEEKGKAAVETILKDNPNALATFLKLDLADLASVRSFVEEFRKLDKKLNVLINNAGVFPSKSPLRTFTKDNFEMTMGVNHLGHFLLTNLLLDDLKQTAKETGDSRIVVVTSSLHDTKVKHAPTVATNVDDIFLAELGAYNGAQAYKNSKLANILFTYELARQIEGSGVTVNCVCPGFIPHTELGRTASAPVRFFTRYVLGGLLKFTKITRTVDQGARAEVNLAINEELKGVNGKYFTSMEEKKSSDESLEEDLQKKMWELSARYCHMEGYEPLDAPVPPTPEEIKAREEEAKQKAKEEAERIKQEKQKAKEAAQKAKEEAKAKAAEAKAKVEEVKDEAKDKVEEAKEGAESKVEEVKEKVGEVVEEAKEKAEEKMDEIKKDVGEIKDDLEKKVSEVADMAEEKKDKLADIISPTPVQQTAS